ncbi:hypothetical protein HOS79_gp087 [Lactobacillus phage Nyseid]|uniref:YopX protein domain-containing protein n=1 Tax=Lactobacillus phage Nyseid TaxID=2079432 RepID=A0A2K9VCD6_9CAUD|nr:hypothetical protein HOS79_gp087 [Lactobacillus phage Nyseid]AUV59882.1 hypothetical protein [Lactobacillus phage Nyseid]
MIKFRGVPLDDYSHDANVDFDGTFIYGNYEKVGDDVLISSGKFDLEGVFVPDLFAKVDPKTVGQFTGLKDINGKEIYEGDIVRILSINVITDVKYMRDGYTPEFEIDRQKVFDDENVLGEAAFEGDIEVIGNVHDNAELLGE